MKKVVLSALAAATISGVAYADTLTLYTDAKSGQVFTTAGEGRVEMGDFIDAKSVDMTQRESDSAFSEYLEGQKKFAKVKSHAKTLDFSGTHYFGLTTNSYGKNSANGNDRSTGFELRRNYVQVKGYFTDKDYFRVTMDATKELESDTSIATGASSTTAIKSDGPANVIVKYAYLYLDKILPYTGVEIGIAHRPWIDYEEHNSWYFRSINKVILEDKFGTTGVDTMNSADLGVNFQTKTPYFSSELGLFNGEGYHSTSNQKLNTGLSAEWRLTAHLMGNGESVGKYKVEKDTYANISFAGLSTKDRGAQDAAPTATTYDRKMYLLHAVYNQPAFLIAAQYDISKDVYNNDSTTDYTKTDREIKTFSVNAEVRPMTDWTILARYDNANVTYNNGTIIADAANKANTGDAKQMIYGVAYDYNKNVRLIASGKTVDSKQDNSDSSDKQTWMLTTEVNW
jgi:hypothetical protein